MPSWNFPCGYHLILIKYGEVNINFTYMALSCSSLRISAFFLFTNSNHSFINWASSSVPVTIKTIEI